MKFFKMLAKTVHFSLSGNTKEPSVDGYDSRSTRNILHKTKSILTFNEINIH